MISNSYSQNEKSQKQPQTEVLKNNCSEKFPQEHVWLSLLLNVALHHNCIPLNFTQVVITFYKTPLRGCF